MTHSALPDCGGNPDREFLTALARAFGGAIFFSLPLLMTMEMWQLGFYMDRLKLAVFLLLMTPVLIVLSHYSGIREDESWMDGVADAFVAWAVAFVASFVVLQLFDVIDVASMPVREIIGKVALQAVPASFGAMLANSTLGSSEDEQRKRRREAREGYGSEMFLMFAGALFLAFNVAPTEEMLLIALKMSNWHTLALLAATLLMMHGFVYGASFRGAPEVPPGTPGWNLFLRFTVVGYAIGLLASVYVLWIFGRFEDHGVMMQLMMSMVLAFPAGLGAAAARLVL